MVLWPPLLLVAAATSVCCGRSRPPSFFLFTFFLHLPDRLPFASRSRSSIFSRLSFYLGSTPSLVSVLFLLFSPFSEANWRNRSSYFPRWRGPSPWHFARNPPREQPSPHSRGERPRCQAPLNQLQRPPPWVLSLLRALAPFVPTALPRGRTRQRSRRSLALPPMPRTLRRSNVRSLGGSWPRVVWSPNRLGASVLGSATVA